MSVEVSFYCGGQRPLLVPSSPNQPAETRKSCFAVLSAAKNGLRALGPTDKLRNLISRCLSTIPANFGPQIDDSKSKNHRREAK